MFRFYATSYFYSKEKAKLLQIIKAYDEKIAEYDERIKKFEEED